MFNIYSIKKKKKTDVLSIFPLNFHLKKKKMMTSIMYQILN